MVAHKFLRLQILSPLILKIYNNKNVLCNIPFLCAHFIFVKYIWNRTQTE